MRWLCRSQWLFMHCHARDLSAPFESFEGTDDVKARGGH